MASDAVRIACLNFAAVTSHDSPRDCLHSVPDRYIWPAPLRPSTALDSDKTPHHIPVVDLADLEGPRRSAVVEDIGHACREWGFFQVVNHGIASDLSEAVLNVAREFFALPVEEKWSKYSNSDSKISSYIGYGTSFNPEIDDVLSWRECLRHHSNPVEKFVGVWPDKPANYRDVIATYCAEVRQLALQLFSAISESLGVNPNFIAEAFDDPNSTQILLLNHYPRCSNPELVLGVAPHSDVYGLTILLPDDVPGLQIQHKGQWLDITPEKDALVINIADQIEVLTNGRYKSVEHRAVTNAFRARISVATFFGPSLGTIIGPAMDDVPKYQATKFQDYLSSVLAMGLHGKAMLHSKTVHDSNFT